MLKQVDLELFGKICKRHSSIEIIFISLIFIEKPSSNSKKKNGRFTKIQKKNILQKEN